MDHTNNIIAEILSKILLVLAAFFFVSAVYGTFQKILPNYASKWWMSAVIFMIYLLVIAVSYFINRWLSARQFLILFLIIGVMIRIFWVFNVKTVPTSDFGLIYNSAVQAVNGDFSFTGAGYFKRWVYQLGFTFYEAGILKIFGNHLFVLKLFNIVFNIGTAYIIYQLALTVMNQQVGRIAMLLYIFYIPNIIYCSVLSNQHLSTFLFFLALYILIKNNLSDRFSWFVIAIFLALANMIRPVGSFFLLGILIYVLAYKIMPVWRTNSIFYVKKLIGLILVYFLLQQTVSMVLIQTGITNNGLSNQDPYWKFTVGLNEQSTGRWNLQDDKYVGQFALGEERNQAEVALIKDRLADKQKVVTLFKNKFFHFWSSSDSSIQWALTGEDHPSLKAWLVKHERLMYLVLFIFSMFSLFLLKEKNQSKPSLFLILLGGYAIIHLIIEIQTRYRFDIMPIMFIFGGYGVYLNIQAFNRLFKRFGVEQPLQKNL